MAKKKKTKSKERKGQVKLTSKKNERKKRGSSRIRAGAATERTVPEAKRIYTAELNAFVINMLMTFKPDWFIREAMEEFTTRRYPAQALPSEDRIQRIFKDARLQIAKLAIPSPEEARGYVVKVFQGAIEDVESRPIDRIRGGEALHKVFFGPSGAGGMDPAELAQRVNLALDEEDSLYETADEADKAQGQVAEPPAGKDKSA